MRSIQRALLAYFVVLSIVALGAMSVLVYQTTAASLERRQQDSHDLVEAQFSEKCEKARTALDQRLLRQAQTLAAMSRAVVMHAEGVSALGMLGLPTTPQPHLHLYGWMLQTNPMVAMRLHQRRPIDIVVDGAEALVEQADGSPTREYFQINRANGSEVRRSESLGENRLALALEPGEMPQLLRERFDEVTLDDGRQVRRVTLKATVPRFRNSFFPWLWRQPSSRFSLPPLPFMRGPNASYNPFEAAAPGIFVQYACDLDPTLALIREFQDERDRQLRQIDEENEQQLASLRGRLVTVVFGTLTALCLGGYLLVRVGLAPLARLTEAVSRVTSKDFRLDVQEDRLPEELQPIASRLQTTLEALRGAFAREKQAAADISHELRTPLAALMTTVEVALRKPRTPAEYRDLLEECKITGTQMAHLVEKLLALARLDAGAEQLRPNVIEITELAVSCTDLVRPLARAKGLTLEAHLPEPKELLADADKIREILINLLHNAIEYNREGGSIDLSLRYDDGMVVFEVRDTGRGIAREAMPHIFERFYRADPSRHADAPHAGLGLAIVRSCVELMHGTIDVHSGPSGSVFRVRLPAVAPAQVPIEESRVLPCPS